MTDEFRELKIKEFTPFKWYRTKWGEPRYVAATGLIYKNVPIILSINKYVAATIEGKYKIQVDLASNMSIRLVRDIKPEEEPYVKRAIKNNKIEVAEDIFYFVFSRTS